MKPPAYYQNREQTYVKHFFLEQYLQTVAFHIATTYKEFTYVDCFSGPWQSKDEELADTSIRIALDQLNMVRETLASKQCYATIKAIFIEKSPTAFGALQQALSQHKRAIKTTALQGAFEDNIPQLLHEVGSTFAFFFIDPKGWTGFAMEKIRPLLQHQPCEVMINFMYDFINRFLNFPDKSNEASLDDFFGTTTWRDIRTSTTREVDSVALYTEQVRHNGQFTYATNTRILKPLHERSYFHLVYATRNPKGIVRFRDVERRTLIAQDDVRAETQRAHREERTNQTELVFGPTSTRDEERTLQLGKAKQKLRALLSKGPVAYETVEPLILEVPLVWHTDLNTMIMQAHHDGELIIEGIGARQRVPKHGNILRWK
jgi:three-Cys-motif partner protein